MEARKSVERQMERFKVCFKRNTFGCISMLSLRKAQHCSLCYHEYTEIVDNLIETHLSDMRNQSTCNMQVCEKEMKIKAFSKEGLQAPQKDNPQERAKTEMRDNINKQVEQLETQVCCSEQ